MKKINIFYITLFNLIIYILIYFLHLNEINNYKIISKKCNYFVQINLNDSVPDLFTPFEFSYYLNRTKDVFLHTIKQKYNIQNSDTGFIIIKNDNFECEKIIKNIKNEIKNQNLSKIIGNKLEENVNLYKSEEFLPFKKSFQLKTKDWEFIIFYLKKNSTKNILTIGKIKKLEVFDNIDLKVIPTILIFIFGNLFLLMFLFFRQKIKKII